MIYVGPPNNDGHYRIYADPDDGNHGLDALRAFVRTAGLPGDLDTSGIVPFLLIVEENRQWCLSKGAIAHTAWQHLQWFAHRTETTPPLSKLEYAEIAVLSRPSASGHADFCRAPVSIGTDRRQRIEAAQFCPSCFGIDGAMPTHCPRTRLTHARRQAIYEGLIDFREGRWHPLPTVHMAMRYGFKE